MPALRIFPSWGPLSARSTSASLSTSDANRDCYKRKSALPKLRPIFLRAGQSEDPPYTVLHNTNGFVKYNQKIFTWKDQIRLRDEVRAAAERGAKCLVTNANHPSIAELYAGIGTPHTLERPSVISGSSGSRGRYSELAITVGY
ncbi:MULTISPECIES: DNA adenine methylase [unclassified Bradyrhizobium]|uniref:DNA adenine methylase n=1 Tax=unclassified Bradyrhizobium TaxID=2631580 RepID=UPI002810AD02|nr:MULTISPECIES: DNA adenine methylase [unclassified Bradyrhizobium]